MAQRQIGRQQAEAYRVRGFINAELLVVEASQPRPPLRLSRVDVAECNTSSGEGRRGWSDVRGLGYPRAS